MSHARLHHAALRAQDIEATVSFYVAILGVEVVRSEAPRSVWLGLSEDSVLMIEAREAGEPAVPVGSLELLAFHIDPQRKKVVRELAIERGWFDGETAHTVYVRDPDGRRVGLSTYPFPTHP